MGLRLSLSLSCHRPGPDASATTGRKIVIVSEIGDPADSDRHRRPPFSFFFSSSLLSSPVSFLLPLPLSRIATLLRSSTRSFPLLKSSAKVKGSSFTLARGIMLTRSYHALSLFISFSLANRPFGTHSIAPPSRDRATDNADRYRRVRTCGDFRGFAAGRCWVGVATKFS